MIYVHRFHLEEQKNAVDRVSLIFDTVCKSAEELLIDNQLNWGRFVSSIQQISRGAPLSKASLYSANGTLVYSFPNLQTHQITVLPRAKLTEIREGKIFVVGPLSPAGKTNYYLHLDFSLVPLDKKFSKMSWLVCMAGIGITLVITGILFLSITRLFMKPLNLFKEDFESTLKSSEKIQNNLAESVSGLDQYHNFQIQTLHASQESSRVLKLSLNDCKNATLKIEPIHRNQDLLTQKFSDTAELVGEFHQKLNLFLSNIFSDLKTIDEIHRKGNLLTLNAFIEGNRAGVGGHGLQVIATSIREINMKAETVLHEIFKKWNDFEQFKNDISISQANFQKLQEDFNSHHEDLVSYYERVDQLVREASGRFNELQTISSQNEASFQKLENFQNLAITIPDNIHRINQDLKQLLEKLDTHHYSNLVK